MPYDTSAKLLPGGSATRITIVKESNGENGNEDHNENTGCDEEESSRTYLEYAHALGDAIFTCFVVAPLVVGVWRGCWGLMDLYAEYFPYLHSFQLGIAVHVCFALLRSWLTRRSVGAWSWGAGRWLRERAICRLYTVVFTLACILHWRGGWGLFDAAVNYLAHADAPHRGLVLVAATTLPAIGLGSLRPMRNLLASPYFLVTDGKEPTYIFSTRYKTGSGKELSLYALDCVFSVAVVGSLVVLVWRGSWALLDFYLFPDDNVLSHWISLVVGYSAVGLSFSLQPGVRWACARLHGAPRLLLADLFHLLSFCATINVWRAVWGLLDDFFLPDRPELSNWITQVGCLSLLMLLNCSNSVLVRGVYIDAEEPAGECVDFPCHYLRLFFHRERTKKRHRRALLAAAASASRSQISDATASLTPILQLPTITQEKV